MTRLEKVYLVLKSAQDKNLGTKLLARWKFRAAIMRRLNSLRYRLMQYRLVP